METNRELVCKKARQGDLLIIRLDVLPDNNLKSSDSLILAHGEVTGHSHRVVDEGGVAVFENDVGQKFVKASEPWCLAHDEHGNIWFEKGVYEVRRQREYSPEAIRQVRD